MGMDFHLCLSVLFMFYFSLSWNVLNYFSKKNQVLSTVTNNPKRMGGGGVEGGVAPFHVDRLLDRHETLRHSKSIVSLRDAT
jgi:hypothetical protein